MIPNRQKLIMTLKACTNPESPGEFELAYQCPYSQFLKNELNAETNRAIHRFDVEEMLAFREFISEKERRKEEEERIKDEIAREESQDRRMFQQKDNLVTNMKAMVESKDLQDLKELKAALPSHIQVIKAKIAAIDEVIAAHVAKREEISEAVQAMNEESSEEFMDYLRENPDELVTPKGETIHLTEEMIEEVGKAISTTDSCKVCEVNPDFEERITAMPGKEGATFCINRDSFVNELKCLALAAQLGISITAFLRANKGKQSIVGPKLSDDDREKKSSYYSSFIEEGVGLQNAREKQVRVQTKLERLEALRDALNAVVELGPELDISAKQST